MVGTIVAIWILCGVFAALIESFNAGFEWGNVISTTILGPISVLFIIFNSGDEDWKKHRKEK